ncbi:MAG TPA: inorganic diphosphatase [Candidatus Saccharimonadales bacterium]|nr:inorganic diphosphatase [Candidatus Saccharimonadales bacterium]
MHNIPIGENFPESFNVVIEIPAHSRNKYEFDEGLGTIKLDRVNYAAMAHPYDYGFIPQTRSEDGDHLDAMLFGTTVFPGCVVEARPIALLNKVDDGEVDKMVLCVPVEDIKSGHITSLDDINDHIPIEIAHFFERYKELKHKTVEIVGWEDAAAAKAEVRRAYEAEQARN